MARHKATTDWKHRAWVATLEQRPYPKLDQARLEVEFVFKRRGRRDYDNLVASLKPVIDGIVVAGALWDDSIDILHTITLRAKVDPNGSPGMWLSVIPDPV